MAIDKMIKVTVLCPVVATQRLLKKIHALSVMEVVDVFSRHEQAKEVLQHQEVSTEDSDRELQKINLILGLLDVFAPEKKGFVAGLAPVPLLIEPKELEKVRQEFDLEKSYAAAFELDAAYRRIERSLGDISNRLKDLKPLEYVPFRIADFNKQQRIRLTFGNIPARNLSKLQSGVSGIPSASAWEEVLSEQFNRRDGNAVSDLSAKDKDKDKAQIVVAFLMQDEAAVLTRLGELGFETIALPAVSGTIRDHIRDLESDFAELEERLQTIRAKAATMSGQRRSLLVLRAFWEDSKKLALTRVQSAHGKWVQVVTGYVRSQDVGVFENALKKEFPQASILLEEPTKQDTPPVSISLPPLVRPVQMLVNLFGLPPYSSFDPTPFIAPTFLLFFGICFSDVAYGMMLILLSLYVMAKTKAYAGIYNFAKLLLYAGISTVIFGFLLGSWFGDLYMPKYLGENNIVWKIMTTTQVIDPLQKPIVVLLIALTIGMFNQFYGIAMKMYGAILRGDKETALFDGLLWLIILPGFVLMVAKMFAPLPQPLFFLGLLLFAVGAMGLVLTQGRDANGIAGRVITGVISLYGIVGTYGITAFIGDTMSYCRLLALALTTGIVALSFNMMADLLRPIPYVGLFLFVFVLVFAHIFNFLISVLGAFVHSMRLIFVEFFGRFYESGGKPFEPLGFNSKLAVLRKSD